MQTSVVLRWQGTCLGSVVFLLLLIHCRGGPLSLCDFQESGIDAGTQVGGAVIDSVKLPHLKLNLATFGGFCGSSGVADLTSAHPALAQHLPRPLVISSGSFHTALSTVAADLSFATSGIGSDKDLVHKINSNQQLWDVAFVEVLFQVQDHAGADLNVVIPYMWATAEDEPNDVFSIVLYECPGLDYHCPTPQRSDVLPAEPGRDSGLGIPSPYKHISLQFSKPFKAARHRAYRLRIAVGDVMDSAHDSSLYVGSLQLYNPAIHGPVSERVTTITPDPVRQGTPAPAVQPSPVIQPQPVRRDAPHASPSPTHDTQGPRTAPTGVPGPERLRPAIQVTVTTGVVLYGAVVVLLIVVCMAMRRGGRRKTHEELPNWRDQRHVPDMPSTAAATGTAYGTYLAPTRKHRPSSGSSTPPPYNSYGYSNLSPRDNLYVQPTVTSGYSPQQQQPAVAAYQQAGGAAYAQQPQPAAPGFQQQQPAAAGFQQQPALVGFQQPALTGFQQQAPLVNLYEAATAAKGGLAATAVKRATVERSLPSMLLNTAARLLSDTARKLSGGERGGMKRPELEKKDS